MDVDQWIDWALAKGLHKDVVGYVSHMKQDLFTFDPKSSGHAFATPRTWEFVSQILAMEDEIGEETALDLISGTIGDGLAVKHSAFRKHAAKLPKAMDVLEGKVTNSSIQDQLVCCCLYSRSSTDQFIIEYNSITKFILGQFRRWCPLH